MYLKISNYEKILDAPHPSYTCIWIEELSSSYSIQIVEDDTQQPFQISVERKSNENNKFIFRISTGTSGQLWDYGEMEIDDIKNRTLFFKLLCHAIEEVKQNSI
jgi:hypothetical protein